MQVCSPGTARVPGSSATRAATPTRWQPQQRGAPGSAAGAAGVSRRWALVQAAALQPLHRGCTVTAARVRPAASRLAHASQELFSEDERVRVLVTGIQDGGRRVSLSTAALEVSEGDMLHSKVRRRCRKPGGASSVCA